MSDLKLDPDTGDLFFENGDLVMTSGPDAIRQHISQRLKSFAGEWFLDLDSGLPYYRDILVKNPNTPAVAGLLQEEIVRTPGVLELTDFNLNLDKGSRTLKVSFNVLVDGNFILKFAEALGV